MPETALKRCAVCQNWSHCTATGYCNCGAYSVREGCANKTTAIREAIALLHEALRSEHLTPWADSRIRAAILKLENANG